MCMRPYGTPFVTKLEIAYGHHVSELSRVSLHGDRVSLRGDHIQFRVLLQTACRTMAVRPRVPGGAWLLRCLRAKPLQGF